MLLVEGYRGRKGGHEKVPNNLFGIHTGNSEIYSGYYADFFQLSKADQEKVQYERKQVGKNAKGCGKNAKNSTIMSVRSIKAMKSKLKAQTITISAMKEKFDTETNDPVTDDAGDSFGGRKDKKKSKKRKTNHDSDKELLVPLLWFWINLRNWLLYFIRDRGGAM